MCTSVSLQLWFETRGLAPALLTMKAVVVGVAAMLGATSARAQTVESFYQGKTITLVLFTTPASIYDTYARMLARVMPKPPAAFSPLTMTKSSLSVSMRRGSSAVTTSRPGFPMMSPRKRMRICGP